jgi:hypothetical protein
MHAGSNIYKYVCVCVCVCVCEREREREMTNTCFACDQPDFVVCEFSNTLNL